MSLTFPTSPVNGQLYVLESRTWEYNGTGWKLNSRTNTFDNTFKAVAYVEQSVGELPAGISDDPFYTLTYV